MPNFLRTSTGNKLPLTLSPSETAKFIHRDDVVQGLSREGRYANQTVRPYRVGEHSVLLTRAARRDHMSTHLQRALLMHDAAEAYLRDIPGPVKAIIGPGYTQLENKILEAIRIRFNIEWGYPIYSLVKEYDARILKDEMSQAMIEPDYPDDDHEELGVKINFWSETRTRKEFLIEWDRLGIS